MEILNINILWAESQPSEYDSLYKVMHQLVKENGRLTLARTEYSALKALRHSRYSLLITELFLPKNQKMVKEGLISLDAGMRIMQLLRRNTNWKTSCDCKILVFSSSGPKERWNDAKVLVGNNGFLLHKPERVSVVLEKIAELLEIPKEKK